MGGMERDGIRIEGRANAASTFMQGMMKVVQLFGLKRTVVADDRWKRRNRGYIDRQYSVDGGFGGAADAAFSFAVFFMFGHGIRGQRNLKGRMSLHVVKRGCKVERKDGKELGGKEARCEHCVPGLR